MTEFKPNPFKVAWEELIIDKLATMVNSRFNLDYDLPSYYSTKQIVIFIINNYKEEMEKQKEIKK